MDADGLQLLQQPGVVYAIEGFAEIKKGSSDKLAIVHGTEHLFGDLEQNCLTGMSTPETRLMRAQNAVGFQELYQLLLHGPFEKLRNVADE